MATVASASLNLREEQRRTALSMLQHRGPDHAGQYADRNLWLGHTRLSILDLSDAGRQPMSSGDDRFVITYNGEVYNFRELASSHGLADLRSASDTEIVLRLFAEFGTESLPKLNGMFAFAVYDKQEKKLWLVRDRMGIKPLYYYFDSKLLAFASEIKGIFALLDDRPGCNPGALHEWLYYGNTLGGQTLYDGIIQLLPGQYLECDLQTLEIKTDSYWSLDKEVCGVRDHSVGRDIVRETRQLLEQAVQRQLVSDVPVGVFLSGGIDSSAIAAFASRHYPRQLATYSVGFDFSPNGGELPIARRVAELYKTDHHEIHVAGADIGQIVEKMVVHHDMPFSDAANIPLYLMADGIKDQTKVVLQGDGGDELFGGYRRYATLRHYRAIRSMALLLQHIVDLSPESVMQQRIRRYLHAFAAKDLTSTMALLLSPVDRDSHVASIFQSEFAEQVTGNSDPFSRYRLMRSQFSDQDIGNQMSFVDMSIVLPDTYLEKVDRSTMAASLEVRVPFLDNDLVRHVAGISGSRKMPFGRKKWLLKQALKGIVPDATLFGPKRGFGVPYGRWLQTSLKTMFFDNLATFGHEQPDILNNELINQLFAQTESGRRDHSPLLWKMFNFVVWANAGKVDFGRSGI